MPKRQVDFTGVDKEIRKRQRSVRVPEGEYLLKVMQGTWQEGNTADYISWRFQIQAPAQYKGGTLFCNTSMSKKALWNLRNLIFAAKGRNVAGKAVNFDPDSLVGSVIGSSVADDEYNDQIRSVPIDFFPQDQYEGEEDDGEDNDEDEDTEVEEEEEGDEDLEDVDLEEL